MKKFKAFLSDARKELKRVSWPDRPKVMETSLVVSICSAIFALYLWLVDYGIYHLFQVVLY